MEKFQKSQKKMTLQDLKKAFKTEPVSPNKLGAEGEDHINISTKSKYQLGRVLAPEYNKTFYYPHIGKFASVMGLWYWIRNENFDDNLRNLTGYKLSAYIQANNAYGGYTQNFKAIIAYATWIKLKKYKDLIKEIENLNTNKIKFVSYRTIKDSGLRLSTKYSDLFIQIANEIVAAVKEKRDPNFDFLCDDEHKDLHYLEAVFLRAMGEKKVQEMKNGNDSNFVNSDSLESELEAEEKTN